MAVQSFRRVSRRQLLQLGMMSAAGALLAACSGGASQPAAAAGQQGAPAVSKAQSGKTIKFGTLASFKGDALEKALPEFEKASGIKVQLDKLPLENLVDKLTVS